MKRLARLGLLLLVLGLAFFGGIRLLRHRLWSARPAGAPPIRQHEANALDLRPAAIAKLQGLVQAGSDSLYRLRVDSLHTEASSGTLVFRGVGLEPDSAVLQRWRAARRLPDDVFRVELDRLRISGISLGDFVHQRNLDLRAIVLDSPRIAVYHRPQPYNAAERAAPEPSLFSRLHGALDRLVIDTVRFTGGTVVDWNGDVKNSFQHLSLLLGAVRVDSATERDPSRFLFAKTARLQAGAVHLPVGHSGYDLLLGGVAIDGGRDVRIRNLALHPQGGREAFARRQRERVTVFTIDVPVLTLRGADWWAALHGEALRAREAVVLAPRMNVYLDKRLPTTPGINRDNFPQQQLQHLSTPVSFGRISITGGLLAYDEFNDQTDALGHLFFNNVALTAAGVTNIPREVAAQRTTRVAATGRLLNATPITARFVLELPESRRGAFRADAQIGATGSATLDPLAETLGLVRINSGQLDAGEAHLSGNNDAVRGTLALQYHDLHLALLKPKRNADGRLKRKLLISKLGDAILVKDGNPQRGILRQPDFSLLRTDQPSFFNFLWNALIVGMLKTLGVPERFSPTS